MNRVESIFASLRREGRKGLMPFVCGGHPSAEATERVLPALERGGACIAEVGVPFSDPIADGPVIAGAMHEALGRGVTPESVFAAVARARAGCGLGLVCMVSVSIVERVGAARLAGEAARAGFDGFILPDVPVEEAGAYGGPIADAGLTMSLLVAPTTPPERAERIVRACTGFVYLLARAGITGDAAGGAGGPGGAAVVPGGAAPDGEALRGRVEMLRGMTGLPIACGFGISGAEQVRAVVHSAGADAAIVGSALVRRMARAAQQGGSARDIADDAEAFIRGAAAGLSA